MLEEFLYGKHVSDDEVVKETVEKWFKDVESKLFDIAVQKLIPYFPKVYQSERQLFRKITIQLWYNFGTFFENIYTFRLFLNVVILLSRSFSYIYD